MPPLGMPECCWRYHFYKDGPLHGSIFKPYPQQPPYPANVQAFVESWLSEHPKARVITVEAYPFLSASVARVYIWIVDGDENLNLHLVAEGFFRGSTQVPMLRTADLLVSAHESGVFRKKLVAAWNAAGQRKTLPGGIPTLLEERFDIDLEFTMADY